MFDGYGLATVPLLMMIGVEFVLKNIFAVSFIDSTAVLCTPTEAPDKFVSVRLTVSNGSIKISGHRKILAV